MEVKESRYIGVKIDPDAIYTTAHYADIINDCFKSGIFLGI